MVSLLGLMAFGFSAQADTNFCARYNHQPRYVKAISVIAHNMQYDVEQLCTLPRLADIYITDRVFYVPPKNEPEPNVWITLHYNEYSCQYFVREADWVVSRKNCYNTF